MRQWVILKISELWVSRTCKCDINVTRTGKKSGFRAFAMRAKKLKFVFFHSRNEEIMVNLDLGESIN